MNILETSLLGIKIRIEQNIKFFFDKQLLFLLNRLLQEFLCHGNNLFLSNNKFSFHKNSADNFKTLSIYSFISMCPSLPFLPGFISSFWIFSVHLRRIIETQKFNLILLNLYLFKAIIILRELKECQCNLIMRN